MSPPDNKLPVSEHFELYELSPGVYAAIATPDGAAYSNAGIVDLGDQTLIFDTFDTALAAQDLRAAAESLTGRPATYVIISHVHADHWCGNQAFAPQVPIITSHAISEGMPDAIGWLLELKDNPAELQSAIQEEQELLEGERDPHKRAALDRSIKRMGLRLETLPDLELHYPTLTFGDRLVFHGSQRRAELVEVAPGHTADDVYLLLPEERIVFLGDLGFFGCQPFTVWADPPAWVVHLEEMEGSNSEIFVPGHGPLGTKSDLALQRQYILELETMVTQAVREGLSAEETMGRPLPAPFDTWLEEGLARWEANVLATHKRLSAGVAA
jgi:glyoxylase-like metal-dependent hydrolase (beta-lactamase superfamily II)